MDLHSYSAPHYDNDLTRFAAAVRARGLQVPVAVLLEAHRPMRGIAQMLWDSFRPLLMPIMGGAAADRITGLLQNPDSVDQLLKLLEGENDGRR